MTRRVRLLTIAAVAVLLAGGGLFLAIRYSLNKVNEAIPQADLFGPDEPTPTTPGATPTPSPTPPPGSDIKGPLNFLIVGEDTRESLHTAPHGDAVMIMHINKERTKAYLTSLPRDLLVSIPAFAPSGSGATRSKLTHAMTFGAKVRGQNKYDPKQGFQLVFKTVSAYTGIKKFDAGALTNFRGLTKLVDQIGGIDLYVDRRVVSIHRTPDGKLREPCGSCTHGLSGPRAVYEVGMRHFKGWEALDYSRQRYGLPNGAYDRERHHRQVLMAVAAKMFSKGMWTDPVALGKVVKAVGWRLTFDGRGRQPTEFGYALRNIGVEDVTPIGLPGHGAYSGGGYAGESLDEGTKNAYFKALREDKLDAFVKSHPKLVNKVSVDT